MNSLSTVNIYLLVAEGAGMKQPRLSVGGSSEVPLNVEETDLSKLAASILAPSGKEEPCELKRLDNGQTGFTWNLHHLLADSIGIMDYSVQFSSVTA